MSSTKQETPSLENITTSTEHQATDQMLLSTYEYLTIPAELFYRVMKTQNKLLLLLNPLPKNEAPSESQMLLVNQTTENSWMDIQQEYWERTSKSEYKSFLTSQKRELISNLEMFIIVSLFELCKYGMKEGFDGLKKLNIKGTLEEIAIQIEQRHTRYEVKMEQKRKESSDVADNDYYKMIGKASQVLGFHVPANILLAEWVGLFLTIKESNK